MITAPDKALVSARALLDEAPMSRTQIVAVMITSGLSALDGFDVLSATFAAPGFSKSLGIGKGVLGLILSSSLAGMALGSFVIAPFADVIGRRRMVVVNLALMAIGMLMSAFAASATALAAWRFVTGMGIGAMVPIIAPLAAEYANRRRRSLSMAIMSVGYPLGGTLGGAVAAILLHRFDWPAVFLLGAAMALFMLPVVLIWLPESPSFLAERRDADSLERINMFLARCGLPAVGQLPPLSPKSKSSTYREIFQPGQRAATIRVTITNLLFLLTVYFFLSWMPQLVVDLGFTPSAATSISAIGCFAGVAATLVSGVIIARGLLRPVAAITMIGMGIATAAFGHTPADFVLLAIMAAIVIALLNCGILSLHLLVFHSFEPRMRATGTGFVMGMGRISAALAPAFAGAMFASGAARGEVTIVIGAAAILAGILVILPRQTPAAR